MALDLCLLAIGLAAASGLPAICLDRSSSLGERAAAWLLSAAAVAGTAGAGSSLVLDLQVVSSFPWPVAGEAAVGLDPLSAFFLLPVFLIGSLGAIYGLGYWPQAAHPENGRKVRLFWGLLIAGMATLIISRQAVVFLLGWEIMALAAFFLVGTEDEEPECRQAGWVYLIATHVATLSLFGLFALWRWATGSYVLEPATLQTIGPGAMNALFFLGLIGFGLKAGVMPLHFWLPSAHANAPSHVSALLSGVLLKMGIYGLLRLLTLLPAPPSAWGGLLLLLGTVSGLLGVVFAIAQHDIKRLLAYHSVENIGIILMGMGMALMGRSLGRHDWVVLGMAGCLLHVWNHSLFKPLLFLCAGSVLHGVGGGPRARNIDRLGGLAKAMPWTAAMFVTGAVAICGLPPLNGFISELFIYTGLVTSLASGATSGSAAVLAAPVLAAMGGLATACFVKVYGTVFLGAPRTGEAARSTESTASMRLPMGALATGCIVIGLFPMWVAPILDTVTASWLPEMRGTAGVAALLPLGRVGALSFGLIGLIGGVALGLLFRRGVPRRVPTWDCGYALPTARMQYTASSFARSIVDLFGWVLRPHVHAPAVKGPFPEPAGMHSHVDEAVLDRFLVPVRNRIWRRFRWFYRFHRGLTQSYVLYLLIAVLLMLASLVPSSEFALGLFAP